LIYILYKINGMKNVASHGWKTLKQFLFYKNTIHWWLGLTQFTMYRYFHNIFSIPNYGMLKYPEKVKILYQKKKLKHYLHAL